MSKPSEEQKEELVKPLADPVSYPDRTHRNEPDFRPWLILVVTVLGSFLVGLTWMLWNMYWDLQQRISKMEGTLGYMEPLIQKLQLTETKTTTQITTQVTSTIWTTMSTTTIWTTSTIGTVTLPFRPPTVDFWLVLLTTVISIFAVISGLARSYSSSKVS